MVIVIVIIIHPSSCFCGQDFDQAERVIKAMEKTTVVAEVRDVSEEQFKIQVQTGVAILAPERLGFVYIPEQE
jgi:hypothetical protein